MRAGLIWLGGIGLLAATGIDTLAVIGRHVGWPVEGAIELVQVAVLVAGALAILCATLDGSHARVHLVVDRLGEGPRDRAKRLTLAVLALFLAALLAGSGWIAFDLWSAHEESELVGVPWRWLRLFANLALLAGVIVALRHAVKGKG